VTSPNILKNFCCVHCPSDAFWCPSEQPSGPLIFINDVVLRIFEHVSALGCSDDLKLFMSQRQRLLDISDPFRSLTIIVALCWASIYIGDRRTVVCALVIRELLCSRIVSQYLASKLCFEQNTYTTSIKKIKAIIRRFNESIGRGVFFIHNAYF
jgi:hypothetical protein